MKCGGWADANKRKGKADMQNAKKKTVKMASRFPTDAESVELRRISAEKEAAGVQCLAAHGKFYGDFQVESSQWEQPYRVEIRSLLGPLNSCSCSDHSMNRLGTCKHVERVLQVLSRRGKRAFEAAAAAGSPLYEIYLDVLAYPPKVRLLKPATAAPGLDKTLGTFFSSDGSLLGKAEDAVPAIERAGAHLPVRQRAQVRLSPLALSWAGSLRVSAAHAALADAYHCDVRDGKRAAEPLQLPLYDYQRDGMTHLAFKGRALLADEMGLGKTVQAIAASELLCQLGRAERILVVSPASLKSEWEEQIRHFTGRVVQPVYGPRALRLKNYRELPMYCLLNYEQVRVDLDDINSILRPDIVILDEAQRIKNWPTRTSKTIKRLQSPFAFVLTGTPLENRIEELYSLVEFIDPQIFGSLFRFQRDFMAVDLEGGVHVKNLDE
ncbi:MAG: SNF2-related protein, partial [Lentisphaerota bacterium]